MLCRTSRLFVQAYSQEAHLPEPSSSGGVQMSHLIDWLIDWLVSGITDLLKSEKATAGGSVV